MNIPQSPYQMAANPPQGNTYFGRNSSGLSMLPAPYGVNSFSTDNNLQFGDLWSSPGGQGAPSGGGGGALQGMGTWAGILGALSSGPAAVIIPAVSGLIQALGADRSAKARLKEARLRRKLEMMVEQQRQQLERDRMAQQQRQFDAGLDQRQGEFGVAHRLNLSNLAQQRRSAVPGQVSSLANLGRAI